MIVIGTDTHKRSHALCAIDEGTGRVRAVREVKADEDGHLAAMRWAGGLDNERVWAIEDCRHVSRRLEQSLVAAGERVVRVAPHRMGASRKGERKPGKSDQIDALAIARAVVNDGIEEFPVAYLNDQAMEIRLLHDHRNDLVAERTRTVNRLRWHLVVLCPELEHSLKRGAFNHPKTLDRVDRVLRKLPGTARTQIAREQLARIRQLNRQAELVRSELAELIATHHTKLLAEKGCGPLTAAILIGHTAGVQRFKSDASFALLAGAAPIPCSSGQRQQHRLNRGGDRQLNHALHIIAMTRASHDPATKQYLARKQAEGKTRKGALRCLKRALARRFYRLLVAEPSTTPPAVPERPPSQREVQKATTAPSPRSRCPTRESRRA